MESGLSQIINRGTLNLEHQLIAIRYLGQFVDILKPGVKCLALGCSGQRRSTFLPLTRLLRDLKPDILHIRSWGPYFDGVMAGLLARVPRVVFGYHGKNYQEFASLTLRKKMIYNFLSRIVTAVATLNNSMKKELISEIGVPGEKIYVLPNGTDLKRFIPLGYGREHLCHEIFLDQPTCLIGTVGRLDKIKNIPTLLKGIKILIDKGILAHLVIVGDGPELSNLLEEVKKQGITAYVHFLGRRNDIPVILSGLDMYVQASWYEGFSNTILEAMAACLPVVASAVGGNPELVKDGETGLLFDPNDPEELASRVDLVIANPYIRQHYGVKARKIVEANYTVEKMVVNYERFYMSLMDRR